MLNKFDSPYVSDWFVVSIRSVTILGLTVSLALENALLSVPGLLLLLLFIWNILLSILAGSNRRLWEHRKLSLGVDILSAVLLLLSQGGINGPLWWSAFLPVMSAALYFEWAGTLITSAVMLALQALVMSAYTPRVFSHWLAYALLAGTLVLGALLAFLSHKLITQLHIAWLDAHQDIQKKTRVEGDRLSAIYRLTETLMGTLNYQRVLEAALDLGVGVLMEEDEQGQAGDVVSAVLLFSNENLIVGASRGLTQADARVKITGKIGFLAEVLESPVPLLSASGAVDAEIGRMVAFRKCQSLYCLPLRSGFDVYGVILFGHPRAGYFTAGQREMLDIIGNQSVLAIQNASLYQNLASEKQRFVDVQEEARKKLARDLHDGPTQSVSAIAMRINLARLMLEKDKPSTADELVKIEELARRTAKEIRHMLFTLRPLILETQGLSAALQAMAEKIKETFQQEVLIQIDESLLEQVEMGKQGIIFFLADEAVNNARKHAQAAKIVVRLRNVEKEPEIILLEIADNGIGFDVASVQSVYDKGSSLGLLNLRERAELVNGVLRIDSALGQGTRVQIYIPLSEDAAERLHRSKTKSS